MAKVSSLLKNPFAVMTNPAREASGPPDAIRGGTSASTCDRFFNGLLGGGAPLIYHLWL